MAVSKGGLIFLSLCSAFVPDEVVSLLTLIHSPTSIWQEVHILPIKTNAGAIRVHDKHGIFQQGAAGLRTRSPLLKGFLDADCSSAGRKNPTGNRWGFRLFTFYGIAVDIHKTFGYEITGSRGSWRKRRLFETSFIDNDYLPA